MDTNHEITVVVFAAANNGKAVEYQEVAYETGKLIAEAGFTLANGAGTGLMEATSKGAKEAGGKVVGVGLAGHEPNKYNDEYIERLGIHARQGMLFSRGNAFIGLPGGLGTLYEISEIIELKKLNEEESEPVIVINYEGFYNDLKTQVEKMRENEFIKVPYTQYIDFVETPEQAVNIIRSFYGVWGTNSN